MQVHVLIKDYSSYTVTRVYEDIRDARRDYEAWSVERADDLEYRHLDPKGLVDLTILVDAQVDKERLEGIQKALGDSLKHHPDDFHPDGIKLIMEAIRSLPFEKRVGIVKHYLRDNSTGIESYDVIPSKVDPH